MSLISFGFTSGSGRNPSMRPSSEKCEVGSARSKIISGADAKKTLRSRPVACKRLDFVFKAAARDDLLYAVHLTCKEALHRKVLLSLLLSRRT